MFDKHADILKNNTVINWHEHVWFKPGTRELNIEGCDNLVRTAKEFHMDKVVCSLPISGGIPGPEDIKICNNVVAEAMKSIRIY